ncbi:MAG: acyl-CoA carboxylase biotin carboxyl carrier protein subunit [Gemmatimonadales bacterium]
MKYVVSIAGQQVEVEIVPGGVRVGGTVRRAELRRVAGTPLANLLLDDSSWIVALSPGKPGEWALQRRGERFEVDVIDERTRHIRSLVGEGKAQGGPVVLKAPMPGLVVRVLVEPGQTVVPGQGLVVLEAMKMENELKAAGAGTVDQILAKPGQAVEKGAQLITFAAQTPSA